ncbi:MAG: toll/interleukin-1 receptor domain-containing protein [Pseudomonadota bacterium]
MSDSSKAVFLSYASQDAEAAKRICEALRAAGVEVWFDQSELVGGDAWDQKIRKQIRECALLIPVISAATQARTEGYFRLEWRLADQRTHLMAKGRPFLLPVVIDETRDSDAQAPDSFTEVQWTRLPGGETSALFCARVKKLLGRGIAEVADPGPKPTSARPATLEPSRSRTWLGAGFLVVTVIAALAIWQPWRRSTSTSSMVTVPSAGSAEIARVKSRLVPDRWQQGDYDAIAPTIDRLILANPEDPDAWALRSIINSLQVLRILDPGTKPLEEGKTAAERALRLAPESPFANLALGLHLVAMVSRGGDPQACRGPIDRAVAELPPDALTRYAELISLWLSYDFDGTERSAQAWLAVEPRASFPMWVLGQKGVTTRRWAEAEKWAGLAAPDENLTGIRALSSLVDVDFYLRADLPASHEALNRLPTQARSVSRVAHWWWMLAMAEKRWDDALQGLAQLPDPFLFDTSYNGPKALLAGLAHKGAGRAEAAESQFLEAERLLKDRLATDSDNEALRAALALTLASAGRPVDAKRELALVEPLVKGRAPNVYRGRLVVSIAQTYGALGDYPNMAIWLRKLFAEPSTTPLTPASLRIDPRFNAAISAPEIQALMKEFSHLDVQTAKAANAR